MDATTLIRITAGLLVLGVLIIPAVFYLLTLQKALSRCQPQNRATSPGSVWLMLIPLFNIVWQFLIYSYIAQSLEREFKQRDKAIEPKPAQKIGIAAGICSICGIIPILGIFAGIAGFICWIIYWVKIAGYSSQLAAPAVILAAPDNALPS